MAASKKRQDEKHLKILRELGAIPANKQCFDCHQRGPTYVNMTIGSFVCTSCSGILRGLNPPHRVKSISMASFSPEEIELIKSKGNEYCKRECMSTYDAQPMTEFKPEDDQWMKNFMSMKYEQKLWHAKPSGYKNPTLPSRHFSSSTSVPDTKPLASLVGNNVKPVTVQNTETPVSRPIMQSASFPPATLTSSRPSMDLLGELGDPFASSSNNAVMNNANASFANFDNFVPGPSGSSSLATYSALPNSNSSNAFSGVAVGVPTSSTAFPPRPAVNANSPPTSLSTTPQPPPKDKYAALADLDNLFHCNTTSTNSAIDWDGGKGSASTATPWAVNGSSPTGFTGGTSASPTAFGTAPTSSNPFTGTSVTGSSWNQQHITAPSPSPGNPFASGFSSPSSSNPLNPARATSPAEPFGAFHNPNLVMGSYSTGPALMPNTNVVWGNVTGTQSPFVPPTNGNFPPYKMNVAAQFGAWQPSVGNPFAAGINTAPQKSSSSNPFL